MKVRLALLLPFLAALGACMMPPGQYTGAPQSGGAAQPANAPAPDPAAAPSASPGASAPAGPTTASVSLRSSCPKTVKVFYGDKPKFGSGTYSTIETNSVSNHTFRTGDMFWLVDDSQNGLASVTVDANTRQIEVSSDCAHLSAR